MKKLILAFIIIAVFIGSIALMYGQSSGEIKLSNFPNSYHKQEEANYCWVTSIQMVLDYLGLEISQTKIAYELRGWREVLVKWISYEWTKGATLDELYNGLDGWEFNGIKIRTVGARPYDNNYKKFAKFYLFPQLYASLKEGKPVIIGYKEQGVTNGHAVVAYGIKYEISNGEITPKIIYIADPASGIKKWTPQDINNKDILGFFTIYY